MKIKYETLGMKVEHDSISDFVCRALDSPSYLDEGTIETIKSQQRIMQDFVANLCESLYTKHLLSFDELVNILPAYFNKPPTLE